MPLSSFSSFSVRGATCVPILDWFRSHSGFNGESFRLHRVDFALGVSSRMLVARNNKKPPTGLASQRKRRNLTTEKNNTTQSHSFLGRYEHSCWVPPQALSLSLLSLSVFIISVDVKASLFYFLWCQSFSLRFPLASKPLFSISANVEPSLFHFR